MSEARRIVVGRRTLWLAMTAGAIRRGGSLPGLAPPLAAGAFVAWALPTVAIELGEWFPPHYGLFRNGLLFGVPVALLVVLLLRRRVASPELKLLVGAMWVVTGAFFAATRVIPVPLLAYVVPVLVLSAVFTRRYPTAAITTLFALTGIYGSLEAFTGLRAGYLSEVVLVGMWLGTIFVMVTARRRRARTLSPGVVGMGIYGAVTALYVPFASSAEQGLQSFRFSAWYILAFIVVAYAGWDPSVYRKAPKAMVVVAAAVGAYATLRWAIGPSGKEKALIGDNPYNVAAGTEKVQGSFPSGAELGFWTAVMIPFCVAAVLGMRGRIRLVALVAVPLLAIGLMGSQVRVGAAGAAIGVAVVLVLQQLSKGFRGIQLGVGLAALAGVVLSGVLIFPAVIDSPQTRARYENLLHPSRDASYQERLFKWQSALRDVRDHPLGRGLATAGRRRNLNRLATAGTLEVDNSYVKVAYEQGIPVMILLVVGLVVLLLELMVRAVFARGPTQAMTASAAAGALASLMVVLMSGIFIEFLPAVAVWVLVGLALSHSVTRQAPARPAAPVTARPQLEATARA
jgi:hypothetical protein